MSVITPKDCFHQPQVADLRLIACPGAEELTNLIDKHLVRWASEAGYQTNSFIIESACPRFQSGDAKGLVKESVRGDDIFIVVDPGNYSVTYKLFNYENHMSPDDHFANLKRLIQAVAGRHTAFPLSCPACTAAVSTAACPARAWTALWLCRSCRPWASRTSSPLMHMTPA